MNNKTPVIHCNRVTLRPFSMNDVDDAFEYKNDEAHFTYQVYVPPPPYTEAMVRDLIEMFANPPEWQGILQAFAVVLDSKVIGEICINQHQEDKENDRVELAYGLSSSYWNKGLMTEAAQAAVDWVFQTFPVNRMYAWSDPNNIGSCRVLEKLGMRKEGLLRSHTKWDGTFRDRAYYGILRSEWEKNQA